MLPDPEAETFGPFTSEAHELAPTLVLSATHCAFVALTTKHHHSALLEEEH